MGTVVAVVSGKGGAGKTCFTGSAAACLAAMGRRVLCVDIDVGLRNLDMILGLDDRVMMDAFDVVTGRCGLGDALIPHPAVPGLFLLSAPQRLDAAETVWASLPDLARAAKRSFDDVLIDCPSGLGPGVQTALACADRTVLLAEPDLFSMRDARQTASYLDVDGLKQGHLVINRVRPWLLRKMQWNLDDVMDTVGLPLLGVVPEDVRVKLAAGEGRPLLMVKRSKAAAAYRRIAQRLTGMQIPLGRIW